MAGLDARITLAGEVSKAALDALYHCADLYVQPSHFEGYGMAVAEALMRGLPVIATRTGAASRLVADDAGLLVTPGEPDELKAALARVFADSALRARLRTGAVRARKMLGSWAQAARQFDSALQAAFGAVSDE